MTDSNTHISDFCPDNTFFDDLKKGNFILILGAGFSYGVRNSISKEQTEILDISFSGYDTIPLSKGFIELSNSLYREEVDKYQMAANLWEHHNYHYHTVNLADFFRNLFTPDLKVFEKDFQDEYSQILLPSWHGIYTFNFDTVIEAIITLEKRNEKFYSLWYPLHKAVKSRVDKTFVAHLHGIITNENLKELVFSEDGYNALRRDEHTLYDSLHNDANDGKKLFIIGTQFDEEPIDSKFFDGLRRDISIYHFDRNNQNFRNKSVILQNPNYHFIQIDKTQDVLQFLKLNADKIQQGNFYDYLNTIVQDYDHAKTNSIYVNLFGREESQFFELNAYGIELNQGEFAVHVSNDWTSPNTTSSTFVQVEEVLLENKSIENNEDLLTTSDTSRATPPIDNILNIEKENRHFVLVGSPGAGKSTVLQKVLYSNASQILNGNLILKIPVLLYGKEYKDGTDFYDIISAKLSIDSCINHMREGRLQILIDGLNEIDRSLKSKAFDEIRKMIIDYPQISVILSSRKTGFKNIFNIKVFELKELQDTEIKELINKHAPETSDIIWDQIVEHRSLYELANNPLYLSMIIVAASKGRIPTKRGLLFDSFVRSILYREKFIEEDVSITLDLLSEFAFYLKQAGKISVPKEKAERIITTRIDKYHNQLLAFPLLAKLYDSNLITSDINTSFMHEAFLDYFCAVKLKYNFNSLFNEESIDLKDIGISDIKDPLLYEPMIMCGDLFNRAEEEAQAMDYFNLLYRGDLKKNRLAKPLGQFNLTDWSNSVHIACKIAFNLRSKFSRIYHVAENYLFNRMLIWRNNFVNKRDTTPLAELFSAISSLSSPVLLQNLFVNLEWKVIWLMECSNKQLNDSNQDDWMTLDDNQFSQVVSNFVTHCSDFEMLNSVLLQIQQSQKQDPIFTQRIKHVENSLLESASITVLKFVFSRHPTSKQILEYISLVDSDFYLQNYNIDLWGIDDYLNHLMTLSNSDSAYFELLNNFESLNSSQVITLLNRSIKNNNYLQFLALLDRHFKNIPFTTVELLRITNILQRIPLRNIPSTLHKALFIPGDRVEMTYRVIEHDSNGLIINIDWNPILNKKMIAGNCKVLLNQTIPGLLESPLLELNEKENKAIPIFHYDYSVNLSSTSYIQIILVLSGSKTIPIKGTIREKLTNDVDTFKSDYKWLRNNSSGNPIIILSNVINFHKLKIKKLPVVFNNEITGAILDGFIRNDYIDASSKTKTTIVEHEKIEQNSRHLLKIPGRFSSEIIPSIGVLKILPQSLENWTFFHPLDFLAFVESSYLHKLSFNNSEYFIIKQLNLSHRFYDQMANVNFGLILSTYNNAIVVFSISSATIFHYIEKSTSVINWHANDVVVIDLEKQIFPVEENKINDHFLNKITDKIIRIDYARQEGHIFKRDKIDVNEKDYYFHFNDCSFTPVLGDIVNFIPAVNMFPHHLGLPKAYKVHLIETPFICKITRITGVKNNKWFGEAFDKKNNWQLDFVINLTPYNNANSVVPGDFFSYECKSYYLPTKRYSVRLLEKK